MQACGPDAECQFTLPGTQSSILKAVLIGHDKGGEIFCLPSETESLKAN